MKNALPNMRILIVDDSFTDIALSRALLESHGIAASMITEAQSVQEAKKLIDILPPEICLIDYVLTDGLGIEVLKHIQVHNSKAENLQQHIASIIVTGSGDEKLVADLFRSGANDYLVKSELIDKLVSSIDRVVTERLSTIASREKSLFDSVTGLLNRASFLEYAVDVLAEHYRKSELSSLIYIDLDGFKEINDSLGHLAGDLYLKAAAKRIMQLGRNTDLVARLGGDEFIVLLRDISRCDLIVKVDEWMRGNETYQDSGFSGNRLRCSVGVAVTDPKNVMTLEALIADADHAMYDAKRSGKDRYAFVGANRIQGYQAIEKFSSTHNSHHLPPASILNALLSQEFQLFFQPIRDIATMEIQSLEVLMRWSNKPLHLSIADVFEVFSEFSLYDQFHSWLIPSLLKYISQWQAEGCQLFFSINAPTSVEGCHSFIKILRNALKDVGLYTVRSSSLIVEINEELFNENPKYFSTFIKDLKALHIASSLDQFSKTETKISALASQSFSSVKVRRCDFNPTLDDHYLNVLRLSCFLRVSMGCDLVAVGVENRNELSQVELAGVDQVQGHFLGEPRAARDRWEDFISQYDEQVLQLRT